MEKAINTPELLAPAGSLAKLKTAISYGADAVYAGGQKFGLRAASDNFTYSELEEAADFCHKRSRKIYIVLNSFLHDKDLRDLPEFIKHLNKIKIDALIISDLGVIKEVQKHSEIPIHLSTQATCLNSWGAKLWKKMGVSRIIVGRECSISQAEKLKKDSGLEVEMFIHGSMCMAYSGNCVISNFTQGRDSNRGGCAHSCRFQYSIQDKEKKKKKQSRYFMSSKDLNGLDYLEQYINAGIDSIKVEGRMKSELYAGTVSKVYSDALNDFKENGSIRNKLNEYKEELRKITHREYAPVNLIEKANSSSIFDERAHTKSLFDNAGLVIATSKNSVIIKVKTMIQENDFVEILRFNDTPVRLGTTGLKDFSNNKINKAKPNSLLRFDYIPGIEKHNIVRIKATSSCG